MKTELNWIENIKCVRPSKEKFHETYVSRICMCVDAGSWGIIYNLYGLGLERKSFKATGKAVLAVLRTLDFILSVMRNH